MSKTWTDERTNNLLASIGDARPVSQETVAQLAEEFDVSARSVSSKLRNLDVEVQSAADAKKSDWTDALEAELTDFLTGNDGSYTYAEIAEVFAGGKFSSKQIQGKVLSMEMTGSVKKAEKPVSQKTYSDEEEATLIAMCQNGDHIEAMAAALDRPMASIRGKALSLLRAKVISEMPTQEASHANEKVDPYEALGDISKMTVAQIAEAVGKTERGVKTTLTRRELSCEDYDGAARAAKRKERSDS